MRLRSITDICSQVPQETAHCQYTPTGAHLQREEYYDVMQESLYRQVNKTSSSSYVCHHGNNGYPPISVLYMGNVAQRLIAESIFDPISFAL